MQIANCRLILHDNGNDVAKTMVTPAQVAILRRMFTSAAKKDPITDLVILPGEAASIDKPAEYYASDEIDDNFTPPIVTAKAGALKKKATYRPRTDAEELARLRRLYHKSVIDELFQGLNPKLPVAFDEVKPEPLTQDQRPIDAVWTDEVAYLEPGGPPTRLAVSPDECFEPPVPPVPSKS